jgi:hypothetical protein
MRSESTALPAGLVGAWDLGPDEASISFAAGSSDAVATTWRLLLPADPRRAAAKVEALRAEVARAEAARLDASVRLARFATTSADTSATVSFTAAAEVRSPEGELTAAIGVVGQADAPLAFGVLDPIADFWARAIETVQRAMDAIRRLLSGELWVETSIADRLVARTVVSLDGDATTAWAGPSTGDRVALHARSLEAALASRLTLMRTILTVASGAAMLATLPALLATPGGVLLAIPAAWRFVSQVIDALRAG